MKKNRNRSGSQSGFNLLEVISVLIILGILAAVAVPKFINLQADAAAKAAEAAVAEGVAQVNLQSARYILANSAVPTQLSNLTGLATGPLVTPYDAGDFSITFADTDPVGSIVITATGTATAVNGATATKTVSLPN